MLQLVYDISLWKIFKGESCVIGHFCFSTDISTILLNCYDELRWTDFGFPSLRKRGESTFIEAYQNGAADAQSEEIGRTRLGRCIRSQNWPWLARSILWRWTERPPNRLGYLGIRHLSRFYRQEGSTTTAPRSTALQLPPPFVHFLSAQVVARERARRLLPSQTEASRWIFHAVSR